MVISRLSGSYNEVASCVDSVELFVAIFGIGMVAPENVTQKIDLPSALGMPEDASYNVLKWPV